MRRKRFHIVRYHGVRVIAGIVLLAMLISPLTAAAGSLTGCNGPCCITMDRMSSADETRMTGAGHGCCCCPVESPCHVTAGTASPEMQPALLPAAGQPHMEPSAHRPFSVAASHRTDEPAAVALVAGPIAIPRAVHHYLDTCRLII